MSFQTVFNHFQNSVVASGQLILPDSVSEQVPDSSHSTYRWGTWPLVYKL